MVPRVSPRDEPARVGVPVRRAEPGQRRHEDDAVGRVHRRRELLDLTCVGDQAEPVAQPLDCRTSDEHGSLEGVLRRFAHRDRRGRAQEPRGRRAACAARVDEDEAPRAVRRLGVALAEAALAEQRGLLIAGDPGNRNGRAEQARLGDHTARRHDRGQDRPLDPEEGEQLFVPLARVELLQHRPRRIRHVDDVRAPVGQLPHEPRVDGPEGEVPLRASAPREDPLELRGREVGVGDESRALADQVVRELRAPLRRPPVLPDDRPLDGRARPLGPRRPSSHAGSQSPTPRARRPRRRRS